jgi:hypothetical protein
MKKSIVQQFLESLIGKFIIGGLTVSAIAYSSNNLNNAALSGVIGAMPIGMPSSIFVDDKDVEAYSYSLLIMTIPLIMATFSNWYLISKMKMDKYESVPISLLVFIIPALLIAFIGI